MKSSKLPKMTWASYIQVQFIRNHHKISILHQVHSPDSSEFWRIPQQNDKFSDPFHDDLTSCAQAHTIHVWYTYLNLVSFRAYVYIPYMDAMGRCFSCAAQDADDSKDHKNVFLSDFLDLEDIGYRACMVLVVLGIKICVCVFFFKL